MKEIWIVGSINMDIVNYVHTHPLPGETVHGFGTSYFPGGKGANQAVAVSRSGGSAVMVGAVGQDGFGGELIAALADAGVQTERIARKSGTSGLAFITVSDSGENNIILSSGANGQLGADDVTIGQLAQAGAVLLQNEVPLQTNHYVLQQAAAAGVPVYYNPAPAVKLADEWYPLIACLVANETEAEVLTGLSVQDEAGAIAAAEQLLSAGAGSVVITLGTKGALFCDAAGVVRVDAYAVDAVDTTAAGDTFIGAFAASRTAGQTVGDSLRFASAAAALTVTRKGAQHAIPAKAEVDAFLSARE